MAASIPIEEDTGTYAGHLLSHRGYYAGDFARYDRGPAVAVAFPQSTSTIVASGTTHPQLGAN